MRSNGNHPPRAAVTPRRGGAAQGGAGGAEVSEAPIVKYYFRLHGKSGATMDGYVFGQYSQEQALRWAKEDFETGTRYPLEVRCDGVSIEGEALRAACNEL